jgi:hypothetical protein
MPYYKMICKFYVKYLAGANQLLCDCNIISAGGHIPRWVRMGQNNTRGVKLDSPAVDFGGADRAAIQTAIIQAINGDHMVLC